MPRIHWGKKRFEFEKGIPRLFLHEKNEKIVKWLIRLFTIISVLLSIFTLEWYVALAISLLIVGLDAFLENTLYYYSSLYVGSMLFEYDPDEWLGTVVLSYGEPDDPKSRKTLGLLFKTKDYANRFFENLYSWTGNDEMLQGELRLTFIIDEDSYYLYLYCEPLKESFKKFSKQVEKDNELEKYGKKHFPLMMHQIICKGFPTTKGFALGMLVNYEQPKRGFLLAPFIIGSTGQPKIIDDIHPILMSSYKMKIPGELNETDIEFHHWRKLVERSSSRNNA